MFQQLQSNLEAKGKLDRVRNQQKFPLIILSFASHNNLIYGEIRQHESARLLTQPYEQIDYETISNTTNFYSLLLDQVIMKSYKFCCVERRKIWRGVGTIRNFMTSLHTYLDTVWNFTTLLRIISRLLMIKFPRDDPSFPHNCIVRCLALQKVYAQPQIYENL